MDKIGGGGLVLAAIILIIIGVLLRSPLIHLLVDFGGFIFIAAGIISGIVGLIKIFSGGKSSASDY